MSGMGFGDVVFLVLCLVLGEQMETAKERCIQGGRDLSRGLPVIAHLHVATESMDTLWWSVGVPRGWHQHPDGEVRDGVVGACCVEGELVLCCGEQKPG